MSLSITVGIPTYKRPQTIKLCLDAIFKQTKKPDKIIIFDSSEDDETEKIVNSFKSNLINYIHVKKRTILPKARNIILENCQTDIITYIDDDAIPKEKFIESIIWSFENFKEIAGVTGPTINSDINLSPLNEIIIDNKNRTKIYPWGEIRTATKKWITTKPIFCNIMIGANQSYKVNILKKVGGFDENFDNPSFREETDVQIRIKKLGYKFLYHPDVFVYHIVKQAGGIEDIEEKEKLYFYLAGKNHRYFVDKHFNKFLSRLSWIFWSRNPPCLWIAFLRQLIEKKPYLYWHKGLWFS
jgi:GT2 family glycosyltransferase